MTTTIAIQADTNDDSSDGGFQFAHPLFANTNTPNKHDIQTSPVIMVTPKSISTPSTTYTRFGRRQPLRRKSDEEVPATVQTKSVARWKRTGRIGLGPPKRAERQSMDEEGFDKENVTPKENDSVETQPKEVEVKSETKTILPPPKMSLDDAPTARKAKTLGRIVMNGREYTKLDLIGKGGSSKVFRVMAPNGRIFALKRVDFEQADQATILGYKSEIDLLHRMSGSDRIIKLYDSEINDTKGRLLMLMEAGEIDLAHMLTKRQSLPIDFNFIRLFWRHMLEAVQAVHEQKIVHSDLKPANFLLVEGSLKLIDFGIAKAIGNDTTNIHRDQQVGTVNYMSPEALSDCGVGSRMMKLGRASDVWSLGCILYQMVYGRTPFSHLTMIQKIQAIPGTHRIEFPDLATSDVKVDGDLLRVMRGCLERDQTQRLTIASLLADPFLRPESKHPPRELPGVSLSQVTDLLRLAITQTREKTLRKEPITLSDIDHLAAEFYDRLRFCN